MKLVFALTLADNRKKY